MESIWAKRSPKSAIISAIILGNGLLLFKNQNTRKSGHYGKTQLLKYDKEKQMQVGLPLVEGDAKHPYRAGSQ